MKKVVLKRNLKDNSHIDDLAYWLTQPHDKRISTVEILRRQHYGNSGGFQRVLRVIKRT